MLLSASQLTELSAKVSAEKPTDVKKADKGQVLECIQRDGVLTVRVSLAPEAWVGEGKSMRDIKQVNLCYAIKRGAKVVWSGKTFEDAIVNVAVRVPIGSIR
jgi:hypothetical protein